MNILTTIKEIIKNPQMYRFMIVGIGIASFVLGFTIFLTSILEIHYAISVAISIETAVVWSFFIHDKWTFGNVLKTSSKKSRFIKFNLISIAGLAVNEIVLIFFTTQVNLHYTISESLAIFVAFFFNFMLQKRVSWKN